MVPGRGRVRGTCHGRRPSVSHLHHCDWFGPRSSDCRRCVHKVRPPSVGGLRPRPTSVPALAHSTSRVRPSFYHTELAFFLHLRGGRRLHEAGSMYRRWRHCCRWFGNMGPLGQSEAQRAEGACRAASERRSRAEDCERAQPLHANRTLGRSSHPRGRKVQSELSAALAPDVQTIELREGLQSDRANGLIKFYKSELALDSYANPN